MAERLTIEEMRDVAVQRSGKCLSRVYVDSRTPLEWECGKGHRWMARATNVKSGTWCPYCCHNGAHKLGEEGLLERCRQVAKDRGGKCLSESYLTARKPLEWECLEGHRWKATPDNVRRGEWCPECAKKLIQEAKIKYSLQECESYANELGGKLVETNFESRRNWLWECRNGHRWNAPPSTVIGSRTWCKRCQTYEAKIDEIREALRQKGIRIVKGDVKNSSSRLQLECKNGHLWQASIGGVYRSKAGCPRCAGNIRLSLSEAKKIAISKGGLCLSTSYKNARTLLRWQCDKGHQWEATFGSVGGGRRGNGTWCSVCSAARQEPKYKYEDAVTLAERRGGKFLSREMNGVLHRYNWQCSNGHIWQASFGSVYHSGSWCPSCSRHLGERLTRIAFETLFVRKFPTSRPWWLRSENGTQLSLDGYCESLGLAFEHQGEQHYSSRNYFANTEKEQAKIQAYDQLKQLLCKQHGVDLILVPEVPRLTRLETLAQFVLTACNTVGTIPSAATKPVRYERAYIEDGRLHRLVETAKARGGALVEKTYFGMKHRYMWRCAKGHEWLQTAETIVNRETWCPYCSGRHNITLKALQEKAAERGGDVLTTTYQNETQKITCRCRRGHTFLLVARNLVAGSWCRKCQKQT
jgi:hypothetical protein